MTVGGVPDHQRAETNKKTYLYPYSLRILRATTLWRKCMDRRCTIYMGRSATTDTLQNKKYYIKTEEHLNGFEQLYSFTKM